jgi:hypothetical protein
MDMPIPRYRFFYFFYFDLEFLIKEFKVNCNALSAKIYLITNGLGGNAAFLADFFIGLAEL